ncbi:hypothetical protein M0R45_038289 [Rubus argutus]|uniref:Uncharacterized protein n=1 Tax=Rubus argutus TaxID=59490 RepID=A0AAW1W6R7_RUBAR
MEVLQPTEMHEIVFDGAACEDVDNCVCCGSLEIGDGRRSSGLLWWTVVADHVERRLSFDEIEQQQRSQKMGFAVRQRQGCVLAIR